MTSLIANRLIVLATLGAIASNHVPARAAAPNVFRDVGIDQRLDAQVPLIFHSAMKMARPFASKIISTRVPSSWFSRITAAPCYAPRS